MGAANGKCMDGTNSHKNSGRNTMKAIARAVVAKDCVARTHEFIPFRWRYRKLSAQALHRLSERGARCDSFSAATMNPAMACMSGAHTARVAAGVPMRIPLGRSVDADRRE